MNHNNQQWKPNARSRAYTSKHHNNHHNTHYNHYTNGSSNHHSNGYSYSKQNQSNGYMKDRQYNRRSKQYDRNNHNSQSRSTIRAPIQECSQQFMDQIQEQNKGNEPGIQQYRYRYWPGSKWQESESLTHGRYFYTNQDDTEQKSSWKKPKQIVHDTNYEQSFKDYLWKKQVHSLSEHDPDITINHPHPFKVKTNTFPIELNHNINVCEYRIITEPITTEDDENDAYDGFIFTKNEKRPRAPSSKQDIEKLFRQSDQKSIVERHFNPFVISIHGTLFTFVYKKNEHRQNIEFPKEFDEHYSYSFALQSVRSLHFYAGLESNNDDDEEISPERRTQIFQLILSSILMRSGFKYIKFPSKGWYPVNSNKHLNHVSAVYHNPRYAKLRTIGVLRGFRASVQTCRNGTGASLKVSNINRVLHSMTLGRELEELYAQNPERYAQNVHRFVGRKALYLLTQSVIDIAEIQIDQDETSTFSTVRDGKKVDISHKDNLLQRGVVTNVKHEQYGLVLDKRNFSFLPQFVYILFDHDLSKKQCKDALDFLAQNVDHELESVNHFISHVISTQNHTECKQDQVDISSLIRISPNASVVTAYPLPKMRISIKTDGETYKDCDEVSIKYDWKDIHDVIIPSSKPINVLLVGVEQHMINKLRKQMDGYFRRRKFKCQFIKHIEEYIAADIWDTDELHRQLISNPFELLILILPNIHDGSKLKRKVHRMCLELGIKSQFFLDDALYDSNQSKLRNKAWGMMSDIIYKMGASTYKLAPVLRNNARINIRNTMVLGLDICHPTRIRSTSRPSIACLTSLYGDIMTPNISQQKSAMFLNKNRQEICAYKACTKMVLNVLTQQLLREDIGELPSTVFMFRDGVSDSQIAQMVSKEMTGLLLAIRQVKKLEQIKKKYADIKAWKPKLEWIVVQKRILDRFSGDGSFELNKDSPAFIIPSGDVVSGKYFEFYAQIGKRSPCRILFIRDDLKLRDVKGGDGVMDVAQFIYSTHWIYPPCIPFQMGPLNVPGAIKYADHYANAWQDMITTADCSIQDIKTSESLHNPQLVWSDGCCSVYLFDTLDLSTMYSIPNGTIERSRRY
eukprot:588664_1